MHLLVTLYFLMFILLRHAIEVGMALFALLGLVCLAVPAMRRRALSSIGTWRRQDTWIALGFCSIFLFKALSAAWSASPELAIKNALWHAHFMAWPLVFVGLAYCKPRLADAMSALSLGLIIVGAWAVYALLAGNPIYHSVMFKINSGVLAELVLVCGAVLMVCAFEPSKAPAPQQAPWQTSIYALGVLGAFAVLYSTHRRTEWIGFFVVLCALIGWRYRRAFTPLRGVLAVLGLGLVLFILFYLRQDRLMLAYNEVVQYMAAMGKSKTALDSAVATSVGARLEMYRLGIAAFLDHPWLGMGAGVRPYLLQAYGGFTEAQYTHRHFHSEFLQTLVEGGIIWAGTLCAAIAYWFKHAVKNTYDSAPQLAVLAFMVVFAFMLAGSVSAALIYGPANGTLVILTALIWVCIRQQGRSAKGL